MASLLLATLAAQLQAVQEHVKTKAPPEARADIARGITDSQASFDASKAIQVGDRLPAFTLPNAVGKTVSSADLLASAEKGLLITFYRGEWCPYCNLALAHLQKHAVDFAARGVVLVAVSPQLPDQSLTTAEKNGLKFEVLSDVGNAYARTLGLVWRQGGYLVDRLAAFGTDLQARNGDASGELPVPTTLLVDKSGLVRNAHMDPDWRLRLETSVALGWADKL